MVRLVQLASQSRAARPARIADAPAEPTPVAATPAPETGPATSSAQSRVVFDTLTAVIAAAPALVGSATPFPWTVLSRALTDARTLLESSSDLFWVAVRGVPGDTKLATHHARVAVMALRLGANLKMDDESLMALGMAGSLFDLGLSGLPAGTTVAPDALPHDHPWRAADTIRRWDPPYPGIVDAVAQHHERERGQGYPGGYAGEAIHLSAKILGLLDQYTRLAGTGAARGPHDAVREIVRARHEAFPSEVIKALLAEVSLFPPGTIVRLSTGERARVVEANRHQPLRPRVELIDDPKSDISGHARRFDLSEMPYLYIRTAVADE